MTNADAESSHDAKESIVERRNTDAWSLSSTWNSTAEKKKSRAEKKKSHAEKKNSHAKGKTGSHTKKPRSSQEKTHPERKTPHTCPILCD